MTLYPPLENGEICPACKKGKVQRRAGSIVECPDCRQRFALKPPHVLDEQALTQRVNKQQADELWSYRAITLHKNVFTKITKG